MKKTILLIFLAFICVLNIPAQTTTDEQEAIEELKEQICKLEGQIDTINALIDVDRFEQTMVFYKDQTQEINETFRNYTTLVIGIISCLTVIYAVFAIFIQLSNTKHTEKELMRISEKQDEIDNRFKIIEEIQNQMKEHEKDIQKMKEETQESSKQAKISSLFSEGYNLSTEGKYPDAIQIYKNIIELDPSNSQLHYNLGTILSKQGDFDEALREFRKAIELRPSDYRSYNNISFILIKKGNLDEALVNCNKAIEFWPDYPGAHYNLSCIYSLTNKIESSIVALRKAFELGFSEIDLIQSDDQLNNIKSDPRFKELMDEFFPPEE